MASIEFADRPLEATARWTASARAQESARPDHLFQDPWASALAGQEGEEWLRLQGGNVAAMVIRTHYFDSFLERVAQEDGIRQIVILAAGLDTRAYRMTWPTGTRWFELDRSVVLEHKQKVLAAAGAKSQCERVVITADLAGSWRELLIQHDFEQERPSGWLLEGILFYLPNAVITRILEQISSLSAPGSRLGFDIVNSLALTSPITRAWIEMQARSGAPWLGSLDDPEAQLSNMGWRAAVTQPGSPDANFGRWTLPVIPVKMANMPHNWYVTAEKI